MAETTFRMAKGDTLSLPDGVAGTQLWRVERRLREGYLMSSLQSEPDRVWTHDEIMAAWCDRRMQHWPVDLSGLDEALALMLQSDIDRWPWEKVFDAKCREEYAVRVDELVAEGVGKYKAYRRAATEITAKRGDAWAADATSSRRLRRRPRPHGRRVVDSRCGHRSSPKPL